MNKSKAAIKKEFLFQLEHFYRNYGNQWSIDDFPLSSKEHRAYLVKFLSELHDKNVINLNEDKISFTIIKLPSQITDLVD